MASLSVYSLLILVLSSPSSCIKSKDNNIITSKHVEMRYKRNSETNSGQIKAKNIAAGDIFAGSLLADTIKADVIKARIIKADFLSVGRKNPQTKTKREQRLTNIKKSVATAPGPKSAKRLRQKETFSSLRFYEDKASNYSQQLSRRVPDTRVNEQKNSKPVIPEHPMTILPTPTLPPDISDQDRVLNVKLLESNKINRNFMKDNGMTADRLHTSKVNKDRTSIISDGESRHNHKTKGSPESAAVDTPKWRNSDGSRNVIRKELIERKKRKRTRKPKIQQMQNIRQNLPRLTDSLTGINSPFLVKQNKHVDMPILFDDDEQQNDKFHRFDSKLDIIQFMGLSDDYIKSLQTEKQGNLNHPTELVAKQTSGNFVKKVSPKSKQ